MGAVSAQSTVTIYGRAEATAVVGGKTSTTSNYSNVVTVNGVQVSNETGSGTGTVSPTGQTTLIPTSKPLFRIDDGNRNGDGSSRFGFRGVEDLGGGLKAVFQFEGGVNVDDGSSGNGGGNLFSRTAIVGLEGDFGRFTAGRQVTPAFSAFAGSSAMGTMNGVADAPAGLNLHTVRESNSVMYRAPAIAGFTFTGMLVAPETRASSSAALRENVAPTAFQTSSLETKPATKVNMSLGYANEPLAAAFGFENSKIETTANTATATTSTSASGTEKFNTWTLGGSYDLGIVKPFVSYTTKKNDSSTSGSANAPGTSTAFVGGTSSKQNLTTVGVTAPVGTGLAFAEFGEGKTKGWTDNVTSTVNGVVTARNNLAGVSQSNKSTAFSFGYRYPLSKRTFVQAAYGESKNTVNNLTVAQNTAPGVSDVTNITTVTKNSGIGLTLSHAF